MVEMKAKSVKTFCYFFAFPVEMSHILAAVSSFGAVDELGNASIAVLVLRPPYSLRLIKGNGLIHALLAK